MSTPHPTATSCLSSSRPLLALLLQRPQPETVPNLSYWMTAMPKNGSNPSKNTMPLKNGSIAPVYPQISYKKVRFTSIHANKNWWFMVVLCGCQNSNPENKKNTNLPKFVKSDQIRKSEPSCFAALYLFQCYSTRWKCYYWNSTTHVYIYIYTYICINMCVYIYIFQCYSTIYIYIHIYIYIRSTTYILYIIYIDSMWNFAGSWFRTWAAPLMSRSFRFQASKRKTFTSWHETWGKSSQKWWKITRKIRENSGISGDFLVITKKNLGVRETTGNSNNSLSTKLGSGYGNPLQMIYQRLRHAKALGFLHSQRLWQHLGGWMFLPNPAVHSQGGPQNGWLYGKTIGKSY